MTPDLRSLLPAEISEKISDMGLPAFRTEQIFRWLHGPSKNGQGSITLTGAHHSSVPVECTASNVPSNIRRALIDTHPIAPLTVDKTQRAKDGTIKLRFRTGDDRLIESVLIPDEKKERGKLTLCLSSQVGCALDCGFCATATLGFGRNLTAGEIVSQVYRAMEVSGERPTNIVFMGMGEPLHNLPQVMRAITLLAHPWGTLMSPRRITVSTVGLVPGIEKLATHSPLPNLSISLNATTDEVRDELMPINQKWNIASLLDAAKKFPLGHGRRITFGYVLLAGVNDSLADAKRLGKLLRGIPCKVNVIPWNKFDGPNFERPSQENILLFQNALREAGHPVYIRTPRGDDIDAACGQLAGKAKTEEQTLSNIRSQDAHRSPPRKSGPRALND